MLVVGLHKMEAGNKTKVAKGGGLAVSQNQRASNIRTNNKEKRLRWEVAANWEEDEQQGRKGKEIEEI